VCTLNRVGTDKTKYIHKFKDITNGRVYIFVIETLLVTSGGEKYKSVILNICLMIYKDNKYIDQNRNEFLIQLDTRNIL